MTSTSNSCSTIPRLPPELMLEILQHLPQYVLRVFAQASRACYAHALEAGLCIHRNVFWTNMDGRGFDDSLEKLDLVLDHAATRPGLNISIDSKTMPCGGDAAEAYHDDMKRFTASIRRALPNLVRLKVPFADYTALCANEAPKLRSLTIYRPSAQVPVFIPSNLFNGFAPLLRKVAISLKDTSSLAEWQPIAAFRGVTHLTLDAACLTCPLRLAHLFPEVQVLVIEAKDAWPTGAIDLRGLAALRQFALAGDTALLDDASLALLRGIRVFEHQPPPPRRVADPVWPAHFSPGELCAVVERRRDGPPAISFAPRTQGAAPWRRTVLWQCLKNGALPLADLPSLTSDLVSLTINEALVNVFVQAPVVLGSLRELVVDITPPRAEISWGLGFAPRVRCPALERIVFLSTAGTRYGAVWVLPDTVARLRRELGLCEARPALVLAGCTWHPQACELEERVQRSPAPRRILKSWASLLPRRLVRWKRDHNRRTGAVGSRTPGINLPKALSDTDTDAAELTPAAVPDYYDRCRCTDWFDVSRWD